MFEAIRSLRLPKTKANKKRARSRKKSIKAGDLLTQNAMVGKLNEIARRSTLKDVFKYFKGVNKEMGAINFQDFRKIAKQIAVMKY